MQQFTVITMSSNEHENENKNKKKQNKINKGQRGIW